MSESDILKLLDSVVSLAILLLVWQTERKRSERLEVKNDRLIEVFIDDHKSRRDKPNEHQTTN